MQCQQCQHDNPDRAKFCLECGMRLVLTCTQCSTELPPNARFCLECGQSAARRPASAAAHPVPSPQTYTPQHLAERIISSRGALEGERKQVTVLFADLKGSMELLADRDPEDARRILDPVLERMMEAVHRYEGTVNQVMGDGIMALFGAPLAHEDHAVRACYAALRMQGAVQRYADEVRWSLGLPIQIRVGLNSGEVVVRSIGSDLRMDYTAVGQTTHLAARMEQVATPGSILLAPDTLHLAEGYIHVQTLGRMDIKGLGEPVEVYELLGAGQARSRLQAAAARGLTRFVGREAELDVLRRTLEQATMGHGQVVALVGEPGVGKSRLVWEFSHSHRTQGWLILESSSVSYGKATSYLPATELLKGYCGIESGDDTRRVREKVAGKVLMLDESLRPSLPALLALLDVPVEDPAWQALDAVQRRERTQDAVRRLLLRESQEQPVLLVFEDLHWIDAETQALLDSLVESVPAARLLLLVNYRPEYEHTWHRKTYYRELRLDPLPPASAEELLEALLGAEPGLRPLRQLLIDRTDGNPFFLEESVRTLIETGVLIGERGAYRPAKPLESGQVPATVQAVLAARIDRLAPEDKRLLQGAAVIGKDVTYVLLQAIAELPEDALRQGIARLQVGEFLYETSLFRDLEYTFKHALTHEVAYGSLLHERRRALHARLVDAIERLYPERMLERVELLAHHAFRGEAWEQAVGYLRQAGLKAQARSAYPESAAYLEQALVALDRLPDSRERQEQAVDLRFDLRSALFPLGHPYAPRVLQCLREAETVAEALGDQRRLGLALSYLTNHFANQGDYRGAFESGERALAIATARGDDRTRAIVSVYLGRTANALGDYGRAIDLSRDAIRCLDGGLTRERLGMVAFPATTSRINLAQALLERGVLAEALACARDGLRIAEEMNHPVSLVGAYATVGQVLLQRGEPATAIPVLERSADIAQSRSLRFALVVNVASSLSYSYALLRRDADAQLWLERGIEILGDIGDTAYTAIARVWLGAAAILIGHHDEARDLAGRGLLLARERRERGNEGWAHWLLAEVAAHVAPDVAEAESHFRAALVRAQELEMRPLQAHCHLGLGTLYQKIGREDEVQAELAMAAEMYRAMEMTFWLAKAEVASG
jgi:class 3 adenylate cyclase/tetratricopeptide (TPR) repeat protein